MKTSKFGKQWISVLAVVVALPVLMGSECSHGVAGDLGTLFLAAENCGVTEADDSHEPDRNFAEADAAGVTAYPFAGKMTQRTFPDIFAITVGCTGLAVNLTHTHADGDLNLYLFDSTGDLVDSSESTTDNEATSSTVTPGPYYIMVAPNGCPATVPNAQDYTLNYTDGPC